MASPDKLFTPEELHGISDKDKKVLHREIQKHVKTDPIVRAIMIVHRGVHDRSDNDPDPTVRTIKHAQRGMKEHLREKLQPLVDRMKPGSSRRR
jgi:hypothetical protein